jgi:hypothetical protein
MTTTFAVAQGSQTSQERRARPGHRAVLRHGPPAEQL